MKRVFTLIMAACVLCGSAAWSDEVLLEVLGGGHEATDVPLCAEIQLPAAYRTVAPEQLAVVLTEKGGDPAVAGQIVRDADGRTHLWWVAPNVGAGSRTTWTATVTQEKPQGPAFAWRDTRGNYLDLFFDEQKVTRYMYAHDTSTPDRLHETYKVFHHVYDRDGTLLTKGPDGENPYVQGLYTHHRGIYIGWNKLKHAGGTDDFWHMSGVFQVHRDFAWGVEGPVLARSSLVIDWIDKKGEPVIVEMREVTVYRTAEPTILLLDFETDLRAMSEDVVLDGDPEHAGFQYRPHNDVAEGPKEVKAKYLFHKDGIDAHKEQNLPWVGMSYGLKGTMYSVLHLNHPDNPTPSVYSAYRDYGRFGAFFKREIKAGEVLTLKYRIVVTRGDLPARGVAEGQYLSFTAGPRVDRATWKS